MTINIDNYQEWTRSTRAYPLRAEGDYLTAGFAGEMGELFSAIAKYHRRDFDYDEFIKRFRGEMGDLMWFWCRLLDFYEISASEVIKENQKKLSSRQTRGVLKGDGDTR